MPSFVDFFGINADNQGLIAALYVIGNVAGSFIAGPCSDRYGRRIGMATGSLICLVGAILQYVSESFLSYNCHIILSLSLSSISYKKDNKSKNTVTR